MKDYFKEMHLCLPNNGNKILKMDKENDTKWCNAFVEFFDAHVAFIKKNWNALFEWKGTQENHKEAL